MAKKEKGKITIVRGKIYINTTFNNTLATLTSEKGDVVAWSSSGNAGFKGTRKSTPYAASLAVENVIKKAREFGIQSIEIFIKGPGAGRDAALRAIKSSGISVSLIADITPMPHNGPRAKKKRRV